MRETKFRAWDKVNNLMIRNVCFISFEHSDLCTDTGLRLRYTDEADLMQYTGLKDRNGKEIYEGDIVELSDYDGCSDKASIEWGSGKYELSKTMSIGNFGGHDFNFLRNFMQVKIIGNIYENLALLTELRPADELCPMYKAEVLPDEDGNCSLRGLHKA